MLEHFKNYLIARGYKEFTKSGTPSTVYDYCNRLKFIQEMEGYSSITCIVNNIDKLLIDYGPYGCKSKLGAKSHNAVISALRRFQEFIIEHNF